MRQKIFLSLFFIPIIILGVALGIWQSYRSEWKHVILTEYHEKLSQKPALLPTLVIRLKGDETSVIGHNAELFKPFELMPITVTGYFNPRLVYYRPTADGIDLITAFETDDGVIAVNAGTMPYSAKEMPINDILPQDSVTLTGFYRIAETYGDTIPDNKALVSQIPYAAYFNEYKDKTLAGAIQIDDSTKISDYLKGRSADYFMDNIPNNHTQYMWTWFLLAGVALIVYILLLQTKT